MRSIRTLSLLVLGTASVDAHRPLDASMLTAMRVRGGSDDAPPPPAAAAGGLPGMEEMMKSAGIDKDKMDELMKSMPGGLGGEGGEGDMPSMEESMEMMKNMVDSPQFNEYMNDPEQLEKSRQMILNNPMMKSMMDSMPGMEDIINDEEKWRESMQAAAEMYKDMGSNLMNMMGGPGGMGGAGMGGAGMADLMGGLAGDTLGGALDELSEGED
mmetsp:Transcript_25875/g.76496  ORF Transcript_25875/g.76496 Transcript_25875/m.76496 type:complete len:213 (-) Transcript_25875:68-706(-)